MKKSLQSLAILIVLLFLLYGFIDDFNIYGLRPDELKEAASNYLNEEGLESYRIKEEISANDSMILVFSNKDRYALLDFRKSFFLDKYKLNDDNILYFSESDLPIS